MQTQSQIQTPQTSMFQDRRRSRLVPCQTQSHSLPEPAAVDLDFKTVSFVFLEKAKVMNIESKPFLFASSFSSLLMSRQGVERPFDEKVRLLSPYLISKQMQLLRRANVVIYCFV